MDFWVIKLTDALMKTYLNQRKVSHKSEWGLSNIMALEVTS